MYSNKLDQLSPERRAVIAYFYSLSSPPREPEAFPEQARRGMSCFLMYVAKTAAHEPGMLSFLPARSYEDALDIYGHENTLFRHALEAVIQKVLLDDTHSPETHRYTTPLLWPPRPEGVSIPEQDGSEYRWNSPQRLGSGRRLGACAPK